MRRTYFKPNHWFITTAVLGNYAMVLSLNLCWIYDHKGIVTMTMAYWKDASLLPLATTRVYSQGTDTSLMQMVILLECRDLFFFPSRMTTSSLPVLACKCWQNSSLSDTQSLALRRDGDAVNDQKMPCHLCRGSPDNDRDSHPGDGKNWGARHHRWRRWIQQRGKVTSVTKRSSVEEHLQI